MLLLMIEALRKISNQSCQLPYIEEPTGSRPSPAGNHSCSDETGLDASSSSRKDFTGLQFVVVSSQHICRQHHTKTVSLRQLFFNSRSVVEAMVRYSREQKAHSQYNAIAHRLAENGYTTSHLEVSGYLARETRLQREMGRKLCLDRKKADTTVLIA